MKIEIEKLIYGGAGIGHADGKAVFVKKSVPSDTLEVNIAKDKKNFAEGIIEKVIKPSFDRIEPKCLHFQNCGGCDYQNISLTNQLKFKQEIFVETLKRQGIETKILPIIATGDFNYRNVMRFYLIENCNKLSLAMHDINNSLIPISRCYLISEQANEIIQKFLIVINNSIEKDIYRQIRIRQSHTFDKIMIELITEQPIAIKDSLVALAKQEGIASLYNSIGENDRELDRRLLFGSPIIFDKIGKYKFQISPESFFQTNTFGAEILYDQIKEIAGTKMGDRVLDLFCGTGSIGIYLSTIAKSVFGIEINQNAVNDAKANARINKIPNIKFICADLSAPQQWNNEAIEQSNLIILDPPRSGLSPALIETLSSLLVPRSSSLVYVSCDPATFARDIKEFAKYNFVLKKVQPVELFPQTFHIECVGLISRNE